MHAVWRAALTPAHALTRETERNSPRPPSPAPCVCQVPTPHPVFDYVMADVLVTIVVELLATPPQARGGHRSRCTCEQGRLMS